MAFIEPLLRRILSSNTLMADFSWSLVFSLLTLVIIYLAKIAKQIKKLPPGPWGRPIVGMIPFIKKEFHLLLFDFAKTYGSIFSFKMGQETLVVLSDQKLIRKAFRSRDFVSRPKSELSSLLNGYGESL